MTPIKFLLFFILLPSLATGFSFGSDISQQQNEEEEKSVFKPRPDPKKSPFVESLGNPNYLELKAIDAFQINLGGSGFAEGISGDTTMAVVVNPFTIRKRSWYYGSVYLYHRNDNFDARNFFDPVGEPLPEFKRNQFGLTFGAFVTDKLTVSGSYDGTRVIEGATKLSPEMKNGNFSSLTDIQLIDPLTGKPFTDSSGNPTNIIPQDRIHPVVRKLLPLIPDPNRSDVTRNYVNNQPAVSNTDTITARVDYEFSRRTKLFGNLNIEESSGFNVADLPDFGTTLEGKRRFVSIHFTHSFNPNNVLSLQASFMRFSDIELSKFAGQAGVLDSLGIEGLSILDDMDEGYPDFTIYGYAPIGSGSFGFGDFGGFSGGFSGGFPSGGFSGGFPSGGLRASGQSPSTSYFNNYGIEGSYAYIHGNHNIAFGGQIRFEQINDNKTWGTRRGSFTFAGYFTGNAFADFLLGIPDSASRGLGSDRSDLRQRNWELFFKDEWKINRKLTLTAQLRYSFTPVPRSVHDNVSFFYPLVFEPPTDGEIVVTGSSRARELGLDLEPGQAAYNDWNDWEPSFSLAYSPFGNNRLVFRASYSIRHMDLSPMFAGNYIGKNAPFFHIEKAESPTSPDLDLSNPFGSVIASEATIRAIDPYIRNPYIQTWEANIQYHFAQNWDVELEYQGQKATRQNRSIPANVPLPAEFGVPIQPRRPNPEFGSFNILSGGASYSSNQLRVQARRRMTSFFSLQADFRWERAFGDSTSQPSNPRNYAAERAYSGYGPLRLNLNYILDLPIGKGKWLSTQWAGKLGFIMEGWRISGITSMRAGRPFTPILLGDLNNDGVWSDRPNRIGSGELPSSERSIDKWFETSDFEYPDLSGPDPQWFGNSGRNILSAPGEQNWDISFIKRSRVTEGGHLLELRVELFNAFNHVNFQTPGNWLGTETFGVISNADDAREIEIAVKYSF
jgi:hypothetical protein